MEKEFKKRKVVVRITESQFKRLTGNLIDEEKSISQFIREAIKEKLKKKKWLKGKNTWILIIIQSICNTAGQWI